MRSDDRPTPLASAVEILIAIDEDQLVLHYQGIFDARSMQLCGAEALVRWRHPELGLVLPARFLPHDMSGGIGWALTNFVVESAVRQCAQWRRRGRDVEVSVNIAPGRLSDDVLPRQIAELLERYEVPPRLLTVEITEHRCRIDPEGIKRALLALRRLGVRLSLDDFGIGDSSLERLRQLHFDEIKIDRTFISSCATESTDRHIVASMTSLAHDLGSRVVAEGVEDQRTLEVITDLGADRVQGFLLHRPGPAFGDLLTVPTSRTTVPSGAERPSAVPHYRGAVR
jgi:EAL domain-containing protein (putative c-di-GMP-specific phosphodiesterase class I)